jgi:hypothetical protein
VSSSEVFFTCFEVCRFKMFIIRLELFLNLKPLVRDAAPDVTRLAAV